MPNVKPKNAIENGYDALETQVQTLMTTLAAAIEQHGKDKRDYADDLLRLKNRLVNAITEVSNVTESDLADHRFEALVFPEHAENPEYEIEDSKISKLWLERIGDKKVVFNWDRGADIAAADKTAQAIVDFLCAGLAESTYGG